MNQFTLAAIELNEMFAYVWNFTSVRIHWTDTPAEFCSLPAVLARDLEQVAFYDSKGEFIGIRRTTSGKPITVDGVDFVLDGIIGSTGLQLKSDPGVPFVYLGFGMLMITSIISYLSHSQVWALQEGSNLHVGGRTNRATVEFKAEYNNILNSIPENGVWLKGQTWL